MALMPFVPFKILYRISARGLDWSNVEGESTVLEGTSVDYRQATSFLFIYMLAALSVKSFVHKAVGTSPPPGADRGIMTAMESRGGRKLLKSYGIDPEEMLKQE